MTWILTALSLLAFAANSLLCRMALAENQIDPISFTLLRLFSGMLMLAPLSRCIREPPSSKQWKNAGLSGLALFAYAIAFSFGYVSIGAGMGTLILVGAVQVAMLGWTLIRREPVSQMKWIGSIISFSGLIYLVSPGLYAPDPKGGAMMLIAGVAWGIYSIRGRGATAPVRMTTRNFTCATPLILVIALLSFQTLETSPRGAIIAICSGAITSGLGYVIWYRALRHLPTSTASIVQLTIPVFAAFGGIAFLAEELSTRLVISTLLILGGVLLGIRKPRPSAQPQA